MLWQLKIVLCTKGYSSDKACTRNKWCKKQCEWSSQSSWRVLFMSLHVLLIISITEECCMFELLTVTHSSATMFSLNVAECVFCPSLS